MQKQLVATLIAIAVLAVSAGSALGGSKETANVVGQGLAGPTVAVNGATILRGPNSVSVQLAMDTPAPGSYSYPVGPTGSGIAGHPEVYSLWVFIFFNPEECNADPCGPGDLINDPDVVAGAFNAGGHVVGGPNLTLSGTVGTGSATFGGPNAETLATALAAGYDLADADIHLAVAPHGALDPALLPGSISTPVGNPTFWWIAMFPPIS
ncbi:MAG: hypothetical protein L0221_05785 [Chloroflexi bacterium]|nr:hypothetical protein [Chloroflexota bacterium]